jgi:hypothetical protein
MLPFGNYDFIGEMMIRLKAEKNVSLIHFASLIKDAGKITERIKSLEFSNKTLLDWHDYFYDCFSDFLHPQHHFSKQEADQYQQLKASNKKWSNITGNTHYDFAHVFGSFNDDSHFDMGIPIEALLKEAYAANISGSLFFEEFLAQATRITGIGHF